MYVCIYIYQKLTLWLILCIAILIIFYYFNYTYTTLLGDRVCEHECMCPQRSEESTGSSGVELLAAVSHLIDSSAGSPLWSSGKGGHTLGHWDISSVPMHCFQSPRHYSSLIVIISCHRLLWSLESSCLSRPSRCILRWLEIFLFVHTSALLLLWFSISAHCYVFFWELL